MLGNVAFWGTTSKTRLRLRWVWVTAAITTAAEAGLSLSAITQLCQPHCAGRVWALSLPGTPAQRGTWSQEWGSHAEHGRCLPPRTTGTILKLWAGDSLDISPAAAGSGRAGETSKAVLSPLRHRQKDVGIAAFCCSQPGECPLPARGRFIPAGSICALGHCALPWDTTPSHEASSPCPGSS